MSSKISPAHFRRIVYSYYQKNRRVLPWRKTRDPYAILVSEIMLQQTQVDRVIPKYEEWLRQFPTVQTLPRASRREVLSAWQGLGYNRRGLALQRAAQKIVADFKGKVPTILKELQQLPGVGPYTAAAVAVFAFNQPQVLLETNVRAVYIHHFFPKRRAVSDAELLPFITATLDAKQPREWYWALMDYGSWLKKQYPNPSRRSLHYTKQAAFKDSNRRLRGLIIKHVTARSPLTIAALLRTLQEDETRVRASVQQLKKEGLLSADKRKIWLH